MNKESNNLNQVDSIQQYRPVDSNQKYRFSEEMFQLLSKFVKYDYHIIISQSYQQFKSACQNEIIRIKNIKDQQKISKNIYLDTQISVIALQNQVTAIAHLQKLNQNSSHQLNSSVKNSREDENRDGGQDILIERYEVIYNQILKNQNEIRYFMEEYITNKSEIDLISCYQFFKRLATKLKKKNNQKFISSTSYLLQIISYLLAYVIRKFLQVQQQQDWQQQVDGQDDGMLHQDDDLAYEQINKWKRLASNVLVDKLNELAAICEQIPQLETFNRNLQFSQVENKQKVLLLRIVDVLISLHHRVSYLSRSKPQLLRELQRAQEQIKQLNSSCSRFIEQFCQQNDQIISIKFESDVKKHNQLGESFLQLRRHIVSMSEIIIRQGRYHNQNYNKTDRLIQLISLFFKSFSGHTQSIEEWQQLIQSISQQNQHQVSQDQYSIIMQLQDCLSQYQNKLIFIQQIQHQSNTKTNQQLEEEVNKLITDFERLKTQNKQHVDNLEMLNRLREELQIQIEQRDNMIYNLSGVKVALEKKLANQDVIHSNRLIQQQLKKQQHQTQKYLQSTLLLRQQLKVSQNERQKLLQLIEIQKQKNLKIIENMNKLKPQRQRLQIQNEQLLEKIQKDKNDNLRQINKLNKQINDLKNERDILQLQVKTIQNNNSKLMQRLEINQHKIRQYSKTHIHKSEDRDISMLERFKQSQNQIERLQLQIERYRRDVERNRKQLQDKRIEIETSENENAKYKQQISVLKMKVKQMRVCSQQRQQREQLLRQLRSKLQKNQMKLINLQKQNEEIRNEQQQIAIKYKQSIKKIKQLESKLNQIQQFHNNTHHTHSQVQNISTIHSKSQIIHLNQISSKQQTQLLEKTQKINELQNKLQKLQEQLAHRNIKNQQTVKQLVEVKVKQYQTTIETHKLIQIKLEEQANRLKSQLEEKVEVEIKLNIEVDRLGKQIDRMRDQLERYIKQLTQKEIIIKRQRQFNEEQVKIIREYQIKQKVYNQTNTPANSKRHRQDDTPSHIQDRQSYNNKKNIDERDDVSGNDSLLSKSNVKYDNYFNAKEYDRLFKQYSDFKLSTTSKVEQLQKLLEDSRKNKMELEMKIKISQMQNKKLSSLLLISGDGRRVVDQTEESKKIEYLEVKLQQSNKLLIQEQNKIKKLNETIDSLHSNIEKFKRQINQMKHNSREVSNQQSILKGKIIQLQATIESIKGQNSNYICQIERLYKQRVDIVCELKLMRQSNNKADDWQASKRQNDNLRQQINKLILQRQNRQQNNNLIKQRDRIRNQYEDLRKYLMQQTQRSILLQKQLKKARQINKLNQNNFNESIQYKKIIQKLELNIQTLKIQMRVQKQRSNQKQNQYIKQNINIKYYLQKISSLQFAIKVVGEELADAKQLISKTNLRQKVMNKLDNESLYQQNKGLLQDNHRLFGDNQFLTQANIHLKIQYEQMQKSVNEWISKQRIYLGKIDKINQQYTILKDLMNKSSEKQIVTNLPNRINPINTNYHQINFNTQNNINYQDLLNKMDHIIQGRSRWEGSRIIQSLQRWRVPIIVSKEIEDLLNYLSITIELIKFLRLDYPKLRNSKPDHLLLENLLQFSFRILIYFSQIESGSAEGLKIRAQINDISKRYTGGIFFTVLEQYTVHILQNNTIEQYKRQLRAKAKQLLSIKQKLDQLITRQIEQQQSIINKPYLHRIRDKTPYKDSPRQGK